MSRPFESMSLPMERTDTAPDGSEVRVLLQLDRGGLAQFQLAPGQVSRPVAHHSVEEIWYCIEGSGRMWRGQEGREEVVDVELGVCLTIPVGTSFQFRASAEGHLSFIAVTMPPWPGPDEAHEVNGHWVPTGRPEGGGDH
jgi:mannose-6-phosphate isomerase-like protein (cupin superfamily)